MGVDQLAMNPLFSMEVGATLPFNYNWDHPDYLRKAPIWETCRDAVEGQEAIKSKGQRYLPKLSGQSQQEYDNYLNRALYYNATGRTVQSYEGMIFRRSPVVKILDENEEEVTDFDKKRYYQSITNKGQSLTDLLHDVVGEIIQTNRVGILVNYPYIDGPEHKRMSRYEKEKRGIKPRLTKYKAEDIRNWAFMWEGTTPVPIMYVIKEEVYDYADGIFPTTSDIYRILCLEPYGGDREKGIAPKMRCKQITFKESFTQIAGRPKEPVWQLSNVIYPRKDGEYLDYIPFYIVTDKGIDFERLENPMIYDLAALNISHYLNSADLENELHMVSIKTIVFPGWDTEAFGSSPRIGGALATPKGCEPMVLEASSKSGIAERMDQKTTEMAVLGSESISRQGRYVQSSTTSRISATSESSILTTLAVSLSEAFSRILTEALHWDGYTDRSVDLQLNKDFYDEGGVSGEELIKYTRSWQSGGISFDTYFNMLQKKDIYPDNWDKEKELEKIKENLAQYFDLPEERYLEVTARMDQLSAMLKLTESPALAGVLAPVVPEGSLREKQELQIELGLEEEEKSDDDPIVPEPTFGKEE